MGKIIKYSKFIDNQNLQRKGMFDCGTPKEFLRLILLSGGIIAALAVSPALLVPAILIKKARNEQNTRNALRNSYVYLKRQKFIKIEGDHHGNQKFILTQKGRVIALRHYTEHIFTEQKKKKQDWDKLWRIFIFDISTPEQSKRSALRHFIKRLGMVQLQKSAWVYPYDCSNELVFIKEMFGLSDDNARLIVSDNIGDDKKLRKHFLLPL